MRVYLALTLQCDQSVNPEQLVQTILDNPTCLSVVLGATIVVEKANGGFPLEPASPEPLPILLGFSGSIPPD